MKVDVYKGTTVSVILVLFKCQTCQRHSFYTITANIGMIEIFTSNRHTDLFKIPKLLE